MVAALGPLPEGWSDTPPDGGAGNPDDGEESRAAALQAEADALRDAALAHHAEAEGWRLSGDAPRAAAARSRAERCFIQFAEKMREMRPTHSNGADEAVTPEPAADAGGVGETLYYLTGKGTYHGEGCAYTTAAGSWLSLAAIADRNPHARACGRCRPPAVELPV